MSSRKPIRVFYDDIHEKFWATQHYKDITPKGGEVGIVEITGKQYDVTGDIARAVIKHDLVFQSKPKGQENDDATD